MTSTVSGTYQPGENKVGFVSDGVKLAGLLYLPEGAGPFPATTLVRPASGIKEQTVGVYAKALARNGIAALAFDPKGYGESEGRPLVEDPFSVISDAKNATCFLTKVPQVNTDALLCAGVCAGAGYATMAAADDDRIIAAALISPYLTHDADTLQVFGSALRRSLAVRLAIQPVAALMRLIGRNAFMPVVPLTAADQSGPMTEIMREMPVYYGFDDQPGAALRWENKMNYASAVNLLLRYDPFASLAKYKKKAFFMAYAEHGYAPDRLVEFHNRINATDKELHKIDSAHHFDLYYKPEYVDPIAQSVATFMKPQMSLSA